jgi:hypothetical protein
VPALSAIYQQGHCSQENDDISRESGICLPVHWNQICEPSGTILSNVVRDGSIHLFMVPTVLWNLWLLQREKFGGTVCEWVYGGKGTSILCPESAEVVHVSNTSKYLKKLTQSVNPFIAGPTLVWQCKANILGDYCNHNNYCYRLSLECGTAFLFNCCFISWTEHFCQS